MLPQEVRPIPHSIPIPFLSLCAKTRVLEPKKVLQMQGAEPPSRAPLTLFTLTTPKVIKEYAYGCDADVGGTSSVHFDFDHDPAHLPPNPTGGTGTGPGEDDVVGSARFHGVMNLAVRPGYEEQIRGGYAGFRNKVCVFPPETTTKITTKIFFDCKFRPTLFGELMDDVSNHRFLALRVRVAGHPRTRHSYFVNIQTEGPTDDDLWQHRLYFTRQDGGWEDVFVRSQIQIFIFFGLNVKKIRSHSKDL
jgi:NADH dehydrogenase [ubiquinone] 1 alpha subcomplex assembly factor 1